MSYVKRMVAAANRSMKAAREQPPMVVKNAKNGKPSVKANAAAMEYTHLCWKDSAQRKAKRKAQKASRKRNR